MAEVSYVPVPLLPGSSAFSLLASLAVLSPSLQSSILASSLDLVFLDGRLARRIVCLFLRS